MSLWLLQNPKCLQSQDSNLTALLHSRMINTKHTETLHLYYCLPPDTICKLVNHLCIKTAIGINVSEQHRKCLKSKKMSLNKGKTKASWTITFKLFFHEVRGPLKQNKTSATSLCIFLFARWYVIKYYFFLWLCVCDKIVNWKKTRHFFSWRNGELMAQHSLQ